LTLKVKCGSDQYPRPKRNKLECGISLYSCGKIIDVPLAKQPVWPMALAKNLDTPRQRAEQNHRLRTNRPRRISGLRSSLPQSARRSRLDATDSVQVFAAQATVLFAFFKILPPRYRLERLLLAKPLIISTCGDQHPQLLHNQHLQILNRKPSRINTCKKGEGGGSLLSTLFSGGRACADSIVWSNRSERDLVSKRLIMCRTAYQ
jgi:hypothetical protein